MITISPSRPRGIVEVPASKSQTIRALLIAAFARGVSVIRHPLISSDTLSAVRAVEAMGAAVTFSDDDSIATVDSSGMQPDATITIDAGNSGTTTYLLLPMAASLGVPVTITGDEQLRKRPVGPLKEALKELGAEISDSNGYPPITVKGPLKGGNTSIECRTSQYLSGLLLASPLAEGETVIDCPLLYEKPYVSLTLGWLDKQGIDYNITDDYMHSHVSGRQHYKPFDEYINGDYSSASFFFAMAAMAGTEITVKGLDRNDPQGDRKILTILEKMGCSITWHGNEVTVKGSGKLKGGEFDLNEIPDTLPILAVTAAAAEGITVLGNVPQARIKETDRIAAMRENLAALGVDAEETEDSLIIHGKGKIPGGAGKGFGDHRIIMALASASCAAANDITIDDESAVSVTFPSFFRLFNSLRSQK